jgi:ubiquinone/menaquinone biosynthesis C-methylase UbiE
MNKYKFSAKYSFYSYDLNDIDKIKSKIVQNQDKYYKFLHPKWTHYARDAEIKLLARHLNKNQKILEIGSGDGYIANLLKNKYGLNVIASDLESRYPQYTEVLKVDGQCTEFKDNQYDAIISLHVLEHIDDIDVAMKEFKRLLKDDGKMYHLVPSNSVMFLTTCAQPLAYIRNIYLHSNGFFLSKFLPLKNKNILRFIKSCIFHINPYNMFWGPGHGTNSRIGCFKNWTILSWNTIFNDNNWRILEVRRSNIVYSLHKIFPFKFLFLRRWLASKGFASANLFILEKKK